MTLARVRNEHGKFEAYAWPGGYDIGYYTADGGLLCASCANEHEDASDPQWHVVAYSTSDGWEESEECEHCGRELGPAAD